MALVLAFSALVIAVVGALCGAIAARFFSRRFLYAVWAVLAALAAILYIRSLGLTDLDRVEAQVLAFAVVLPFLLGSLLTGLTVKRRT